MNPRPRILHFVTGGGSGATKVALELACGHLRSGRYEPLLVLRRKRAPLPAPMQERIAAAGLRTAWVDRGFKHRTLRQLAALLAEFRPEVFAAHGNSEHLWGRQAAFRAGVPVVLHIEQNCERYPFWRRWAARRLAPRTTATICVSRGVADHVRRLGLAGPRVEIVPNGVEAARFAVGAPPFARRAADIIMVARFARQKDQPTLIRAARRLADAGWTGRLLLGGGGRAAHRRACERLVRRLGLAERVDFLGQVNDPAPLYHRCRAAVLSTHYEGLPLVLIDYMAAGCAAIGSEASGVADIIENGVNGWSFPRGDDAALAAVLTRVLAGGPEVEAVVARGQADAPARFSLSRMIDRYETLCTELLGQVRPT
ncbi:MAG: glycosyltransferase [Opitutaceae bacterium]|nr:glycosyltransferase [Opitutaceae bacterium]